MAEQTPQSNHAKGGAASIARLNDWLRGHLTAPGNNRVVMTSEIGDLMGDVALFRNFDEQEELLWTVRDFDVFDHATDLCGEHDLGRFQLKGTDCYYNNDYYNHGLSADSGDPAGPFKAKRVLTIMRVDER